MGLVSAAAFASLGHEVACADSDQERIAQLRKGVTPFFEAGLDDLVGAGLSSGALSFLDNTPEAVREAEVSFVCVGTPPRATGEANLAAVESVAREIAITATGRTVVVDKSTVPAGTAERVRKTLARERPDLAGDLEVASNPEFLREGRAVDDTLNPDRILVGAASPWVFDSLREVYKPLTNKGIPLIETDLATAELAKHASNAFLSLKISFANALARICERAGADVVAVADIMGSDPRIGRDFLNAGLGYGGYCFPKDLQAFERLAHELGYDFALLREIVRINEEAIETTVAKVKDALWNIEGKTVAMLGLSFKPGTDDTRFSPALALTRRLIEEGARVVGYDPQAMGNAKTEVPDLETATDAYDALDGAHCAVIATDWEEFAFLDLQRVKEALAYPVVIDARNQLDPKTMESLGFTYISTGRRPVGGH